MQFSIIIPHHNSLSSLKKLINSIPNNQQIEIIVVDDKSENFIDVENYLSELNRKIIFLKNDLVNIGAGTCRNIGLNVASGKWILFADADDFFVEKAFDVLYNYIDCDADIIFFPPTSISLKTGDKAKRHVKYADFVQNFILDKKNAELELKYKYLVPWSKLIKRELIENNKILFDEVMFSNDVMFSTKCSFNAKKIMCDINPIYCVTENEKSLTKMKSLAEYYTRVNVFLARYDYLEERLSNKDFSNLNLSGRVYIYEALKYKYGVEVFKDVLNEYIQRGIKLISLKSLRKDFQNVIKMLSR